MLSRDGEQRTVQLTPVVNKVAKTDANGMVVKNAAGGVETLTVGFVGIGLGVGLGSLLSWQLPNMVDWIQNAFHVQFLSPDVYYISNVPSKLDAADVGWVALVTFVFSLLATLYPAWRASRTQPAQALRYE